MKQLSYLLVLNAQTMKPLTVAYAPVEVPSDVHGQFWTESSMAKLASPFKTESSVAATVVAVATTTNVAAHVASDASSDVTVASMAHSTDHGMAFGPSCPAYASIRQPSLSAFTNAEFATGEWFVQVSLIRCQTMHR